MTESWLSRWRSVFQRFSFRGWAVVVMGGLVALAVIGVTAAIIDNPFFDRTMPVRTQDYVIWVVTAVIVGLIAGTYTLSTKVSASGKVVSGGVLSALAVGCPICNSLVLLLVGTSGALSYFAPLQLYIGIASVVLLGWALHLRVEAVNRSCCAISAGREVRD